MAPIETSNITALSSEISIEDFQPYVYFSVLFDFDNLKRSSPKRARQHQENYGPHLKAATMNLSAGPSLPVSSHRQGLKQYRWQKPVHACDNRCVTVAMPWRGDVLLVPCFFSIMRKVIFTKYAGVKMFAWNVRCNAAHLAACWMIIYGPGFVYMATALCVAPLYFLNFAQPGARDTCCIQGKKYGWHCQPYFNNPAVLPGWLICPNGPGLHPNNFLFKVAMSVSRIYIPVF